MPRVAALILCVVICVFPASASAASGTIFSTAAFSGQSTSSENPIAVPASNTPPSGRRLSANSVLAIANALPKMRAVRAKYPGSYGGAYLKGLFRWQVSYFSRDGKKEIGQVLIAETLTSARVVEQWTGFQVAWTMARGYPGAFGRHVNALYIWLPLCVLFILPFFDFRRPFSLLHLDLLVLLSFSVSLAFFNHAHIYASVPLAYPPLLYLLVRMLALAHRPRRQRMLGPLRLLVPAPWLALGVVFLIGFRVALNVTDSNVIDVGYAGVIGAQRIVDGEALYGSFPSDNEHGDTYGPVNYEAYVPFEQIFGWSGTWDDLPAAHAAAIVFDLLAVALLFLLGRRVRGPTLGVALAYAWVSFPFTLFALESNSNDTLVAVLVLAALLAASYRSRIGPPARGVFAALAGLTKFAPLALVPLLATHGLRERALRRRPRALALFLVAFLGTVAVASIPALSHDSLHMIYERTIVYQADRGSPFSVWGLYGGLAGLQSAVQIAAVILALSLAVLPRREDLVGLAAACAAVIIATQLGIDHWFYLYIPWFFPLVMLALLGRFSDPQSQSAVVASGSARWSQPAAAASSG
jgi:multisubunit Na+/H+ antiporter MnhF subunit